MQNVVYGKISSWEVMLNVPNFEIDTLFLEPSLNMFLIAAAQKYM